MAKKKPPSKCEGGHPKNRFKYILDATWRVHRYVQTSEMIQFNVEMR